MNRRFSLSRPAGGGAAAQAASTNNNQQHHRPRQGRLESLLPRSTGVDFAVPWCENNKSKGPCVPAMAKHGLRL